MVRTVGLVGAGSVGSGLFSQMYAVDSENVVLLAKGARAERLRQGVYVNGEVLHPTVVSSPEQNIPIDLLIVTVKTYSLESVFDDIADLIQPSTIILPLENGITTTEQFRERFSQNRVLYGVIIRTDAHRMGHRVYYTTLGEVQMGYANNEVIAPEVQEAYDRLQELGINVKIYPDMKRIQWRKWMLNTGGSQVAVETCAECGYFSLVEEIQELIRLCVYEIRDLAVAEHVNITTEDCDDIVTFLLSYPPDKKMSMLQDYEAGRPIELDDFAGTVIKLGEKHGIPTPANRILYLTITAREKVSLIRQRG